MNKNNNNKLFKKCWIEKGCSVSLHCVKPAQIKTLWKDIKDTTDVQCCHIKIEKKSENRFTGCIHEFFDKKH